MNIVIIGARFDGHANVVLEIVLSMKKYTVIGFIDDDISKKGFEKHGYTVIGSMADLPELIRKHSIKGGIVAIGHNKMRRELSVALRNNGLTLINAIHPTVHIDSHVTIGEGNCICQNATIITGTVIGNYINIHTAVSIDHDNIIEDGANLGPGVHTAGRATIGKDAFLGTGAIVIPDGQVGEGAIVGAGSVVIRPVLPYTKVVGVPAKEIKY